MVMFPYSSTNSVPLVLVLIIISLNINLSLSLLPCPTLITTALAAITVTIPQQYAPSNYPLQYINPQIILDYGIENAGKTFYNAVVPGSFNDQVAVALSEGASGFIAGVATKLVSVVDGNKNNKDSVISNAANSGAFFFVRAGGKAVADLFGSSTLIVNILGLIIALSFSEIIKARSRDIEEQQTRVNNIKMIDLMKFRDQERPNSRKMLDYMNFRNQERPNSRKMLNLMNFRDVEDGSRGKGITKSVKTFKDGKVVIKNITSKPPIPIGQFDVKQRLYNGSGSGSSIPLVSTEAATLSPLFKGKIGTTELTSDVVKWVIFEALIPDNPTLSTSFTIGTLAGFVSQLVKESKIKEQVFTNDSLIKDSKILRLSRASAEGAAQFWTYIVVRSLLMSNSMAF